MDHKQTYMVCIKYNALSKYCSKITENFELKLRVVGCSNLSSRKGTKYSILLAIVFDKYLKRFRDRNIIRDKLKNARRIFTVEY